MTQGFSLMDPGRMQRIWRKTILPLSAVALVAVYQYSNQESAQTGSEPGDGVTQVAQAYREQQSGLWVAVSGNVIRLLEDDSEGARHQRFIVSLSNESTVLIAHNVDLASRVPVTIGDKVAIRGTYEWNERGGVIHWTHHDLDNNGQGGWVEHQGRRYR